MYLAREERMTAGYETNGVAMLGIAESQGPQKKGCKYAGLAIMVVVPCSSNRRAMRKPFARQYDHK
jgi:hypothetical protein